MSFKNINQAAYVQHPINGFILNMDLFQISPFCPVCATANHDHNNASDTCINNIVRFPMHVTQPLNEGVQTL